MDKEAMGSIRGILPAMDCYYPFETASPVLSRDFELDNPETCMMGNIPSDMFSNQFLYGSNRRIGQEKFAVPDLVQFPDQGAKVSFLQMLEGGEGGKEECIGHDPFYLKLPVLEEQPDQKGSVNKPCKSEPKVEEGKNASILSSEKKAEEPANSGVTEQVLVCDNLPISQCSSGNENNQRPKRKRAKSSKNSEEVESQRQTHIAVERNRRKQMNEHLNVLRSLMPGSYVQRGDQASIIGGAIEFVKELEQLLQCLQAQKRRRLYAEAFSPKQTANNNPVSSGVSASISSGVCAEAKYITDNCLDMKECIAEIKSEIADVEVKMQGSEALVKILSQKRPGQLLKAIAALESLYLSVLHTNVTTIEQTVLYSFNLKIGMECRLSVDEMASAVQQIFTMIHRGACIS